MVVTRDCKLYLGGQELSIRSKRIATSLTEAVGLTVTLGLNLWVCAVDFPVPYFLDGFFALFPAHGPRAIHRTVVSARMKRRFSTGSPTVTRIHAGIL